MKRRIMSSIILALSLLFIFLGNTQKILISDSIITGLYGLAFLATALFLKPMMKG